MPSPKPTLAAALAIVLVGAAIAYLRWHSPAQRSKVPIAAADPVEKQIAPGPFGIAESHAAPPPLASHIDAPAADQPEPHAKTAVDEPAAPRSAVKAKKPKRELKDPFSRQALALVGADPGAESYWLAAINNKDLPAEERSDLIEDLNEDGISDPDNPTREDLPLIINRLAVISRHAPFAMDQVNADAFQEAYKDLMNMYARLIE